MPKLEKATVGFTKESLSLNVGGSASLKGYVTGLQTGDSISRWRSFSPNIASVDAQGNAKALRAGQTYIAVGTKNGAVAKLLLTVQDSAVHTNAISGLHTGIALEAGKSVTLRPQRYPAGSAGVFYYKSSNPTVAAVDKNGKITAKKQGSAVITVTARNVSTTMKLTVKQR